MSASSIENDFEAERCKVCQVDCSTTQQKELHLRLPLHHRRKNISTFLTKIATNPVQTRSSEISKRYALLKENVLGADCIVEFVFPWCESGWWACSICYESGNNYDLLDQHLNSRRHLGIYLNELGVDPSINALTCDASQLIKLKDDVFAQGETMLPPDVIALHINKAEAIASLVISDRTPPYTVHESGHKDMIFISCQVCHESFLCFGRSSEQPKAWNVHSMSPEHRNALCVSNIIGLCNPIEVVDETANSSENSGPFGWKNYEHLLEGKQPPPGVQMRGPVCGINYLVTFSDHAYCGLCFCIVEGLEDHFSSESHIIRFVRKSKPKAGFMMYQCDPRLRRSQLLSYLDRHGLSIDRSRNCNCPMPKAMKERILKDIMSLPDPIPAIEPYDNTYKCIFCPMCIMAIPLIDLYEDPASCWHEHVESIGHYRMCAKRNEYYMDDKFFVPTSSSIEWELGQRNEYRGQWREEDGTWIQNQFNFGLEFIIDNHDSEQYICTQCAEVFPYSQRARALYHLRGLEHLKKYLHIANRDLISKFEKKEGGMKKILDLGMDLLQRSSLQLTQLSDARVYDPKLAVRMEFWGQVKKRKVELSLLDENHRAIYEVMDSIVDKVADDHEELREVSLREALISSSIKVIDITETGLVCICLKCQNGFVTQPSNLIADVWDGHLLSKEHFRRAEAISSCEIVPTWFTDTPSIYTVKEFTQKDPSKKTTWQYNQTLGSHEFVLSIVGLPDVIERKSTEQDIEPPEPTNCDFYCRLCLVSFPRKVQLLESHVRSVSHVLQYVHKYHPKALKKLDEIPKTDNGKEFRKFLSYLLKDVKPPRENCMPVFDPYGERERRSILAMQKAQEEEKKREEEEERRIAEETRKKKDEERRKQREAEEKAIARIQAERKKAEDLAREKRARIEQEKIRQEKEAREAHERRAAYEAKMAAEEKEQLMALALAKQRELEAAKAKLDEDRLKIEQNKSSKQRAILQAQLDEERKKLDGIREKKRQMLLIEEQRKLEMELEEVRKRKAAIEVRRLEMQNAVSAPQIIQQPSLAMPHIPQPSLVLPPIHQQPQIVPTAPSLHLPPPQTNFMAAPIVGVNQFAVPPPNYNMAGNMTLPNMADSMISMSAVGIPNSSSRVSRPSLANVAIDPYLLDPRIITSREQLVDFMGRQGATPIPKEERYLVKRFNTFSTNVPALIGLQAVNEVVCIDDQKLESYYCSLCKIWEFPMGMLKHLDTNGHRLAYLFKFRKGFHNAIMSETNAMVRDCMIQQFAEQIWLREKPLPAVSERLRLVLNKEILIRLWPNYYITLDPSWKYDERAGTPIPRSPSDTPIYNLDLPGKDPIVPLTDAPAAVWEGIPLEQVELSRRKGGFEREKSKRDEDERERRRSRSPSVKRKRKDRGDEERRRRPASPDRSKRSTSRTKRRSSSRDRKRSRSRSRDRRRRSRSRSRSTGRSHLPTAFLASKLGGSVPMGELSWEESAAAFLAKIGDAKGASKVLDDSRMNRQSQETSTHRQPLSTLQSVTSKSAVTSSPEVNENVQMRKMLGLIVTMQKEAESQGGLDNAKIDQLYNEMGLKRNDGSEADTLLSKLCNLIGGTGSTTTEPTTSKPKIDLSVFGIQEPTSGSSAAPSIGLSSMPMFGQNTDNLYGIRKEPRAEQPGERPPTSISTTLNEPAKSNSSALPTHLQNILSGLKGTLNQLKPGPAEPVINTQRTDPTRNLVFNQSSDVYGIGAHMNHVYPGNPANDVSQFHRRSDQRPQHPEMVLQPQQPRNHPPLQKAQMPVPVHPGQAGRAPEKGYETVFPDLTKRAAPGAKITSQGGPQNGQTSNQHDRVVAEKGLLNAEGKQPASRSLRKKMRHELREKGYNPDAFVYYLTGPEPITGMNLQLPADYRNSPEDDGPSGRLGISAPQAPRVTPRKDVPLVQLDDDDWDGAVGSLTNLLNDRNQSPMERGQRPPAAFQNRPGMHPGHGWPNAQMADMAPQRPAAQWANPQPWGGNEIDQRVVHQDEQRAFGRFGGQPPPQPPSSQYGRYPPQYR